MGRGCHSSRLCFALHPGIWAGLRLDSKLDSIFDVVVWSYRLILSPLEKVSHLSVVGSSKNKSDHGEEIADVRQTCDQDYTHLVGRKDEERFTMLREPLHSC